MFEHLLHSQRLGVSWHHLPALYMLDFHTLVLAAAAISVFVTTVVLLPALRRAAPTTFVVFTCLSSGFLTVYSLLLPDWLSSFVALPPGALGYHDWMASPPLSIHLYSRRLGIHIGLSGANVTMLALPIRGPAECTPSNKRRTHSALKGCFAELYPKDCPKIDAFFAGLLDVRHSRAEELSRMFRGDANWTTLPAAPSRRLLWHEWSEDVEEAYHHRAGKPVHFSKASTSNASLSFAGPRRSMATPIGTAEVRAPHSGQEALHRVRRESQRPGRRLSLCGVVGAGMPTTSPAWFDERVDWAWGMGPGTSYRSLLKRGVPGPILSVAEYLSRDWNYGSGGGEGEGFYGGSYDWGGRLRNAGHWTSCVLTSALILWAFSIPLQMSEPESGAWLLGASGLLMLSAAPLYASLVRAPIEAPRVEGVPVYLRWGACFYCSVLGGSWAALAGFTLAFIRRSFPGALATDLDMDEVLQRTAKVRPVVVPEAEGPRSMLQFT